MSFRFRRNYETGFIRWPNRSMRRFLPRPLTEVGAEVGVMSWFLWLEANWAGVFESATKIVGALVIVGGPIVALWKQIKARTYAPRVELSISGKIVRAGQEPFLLLVTTVKNVGVSRVSFKPDLSYVRVFGIESDQFEEDGPEPSRLVTRRTLTQSDSVESGLSAEDVQLVKLPHENYLAFLIEFGFTSKGFLNIFAGRDWTRTTIINCKLTSSDVNSA